jgi:hypothetical protein
MIYNSDMAGEQLSRRDFLKRAVAAAGLWIGADLIQDSQENQAEINNGEVSDTLFEELEIDIEYVTGVGVGVMGGVAILNAIDNKS